MSHLAERLLAEDVPQEVADDLLTKVRRTSYAASDTVMITAPASDGAALQAARTAGAQIAEGLAMYSKSPTFLESLGARDKRRSVTRAILGNEHTPHETRVALLERSVVTQDYEGITIGVNCLDASTLLGLWSRPDGLYAKLGSLLAGSAHRCKSVTDLRVWLQDGDEPMRKAALENAVNRPDDIGLDEAIAMAHLPDELTAEVLWYSGVRLQAHHAELLVSEAVRTTSPPPHRRATPSVMTSCDAAAAEILATSPDPGLRWLALSTEVLTDSVLSNVLAASETPIRYVIERAISKTNSPHQATMIAEALIALKLAQDSSDDTASPPRHMSSYRRIETSLYRLAEDLMNRPQLDSETRVALLRAFGQYLVPEWLQGRFTHAPQDGEVRAVFSGGLHSVVDPDKAGDMCVSIAAALRRDHPWSVEVLETVPGIAGRMLANHSSGSLKAVVTKAIEAFGPDARLWANLLVMGPGFGGTIDELFTMCAVAAGLPAPDVKKGTTVEQRAEQEQLAI